MNLDKVNKNFISDADLYLQAFNREHSKTPSQLAETQKHQRVFSKRDQAQPETSEKNLWENFQT